MILGINAAYHELSVALSNGKQLLYFVEEERLTRVKHGRSADDIDGDLIAQRSILKTLEDNDLKASDIKHIAYAFDPLERYNKNIAYQSSYAPDSYGNEWFETRFYKSLQAIPEQIRELGFNCPITFFNHHLCHASNAFLTSPFNESLILVIDGIGEFETMSVYWGVKDEIKKIWTQEFPHSLGLLWEKISLTLGFSEYDACKTMGLAAYGNHLIHLNNFLKFINIESDGSFFLDDTIAQLRTRDCSELRKVFGENYLREDVAATLQYLTEEIVFKVLKYWQHETGLSNLCMAGGVALNCAVTGKIIETCLFDDVFIPPTCNDAGCAIGAVALIESKKISVKYPYLGPQYVLDKTPDWCRIICCDSLSCSVAKLIADGNIVALFQGRVEAGPRALGNRSLIADPRDLETRERINRQVKHREPFRPLCPTILREMVDEYFSYAPSVAKYMLAALKVKESKKHLIPAVVHHDGTCRVQILSQGENDLFYQIIKEFYKLTGIPLVLNTSFNDSEPIVCSIMDALKMFEKSDLKYIVINNLLLKKI